MTKRILIIGSCNNCPNAIRTDPYCYCWVCGKTGKALEKVNNFGNVSIPEDCPLPKKGVIPNA